MKLPLHRLCTNNDVDIKFWSDLDETEEFSLDVIDDIAGEASEIAKTGNTFFTYGCEPIYGC